MARGLFEASANAPLILQSYNSAAPGHFSFPPRQARPRGGQTPDALRPHQRPDSPAGPWTQSEGPDSRGPGQGPGVSSTDVGFWARLGLW